RRRLLTFEEAAHRRETVRAFARHVDIASAGIFKCQAYELAAALDAWPVVKLDRGGARLHQLALSITGPCRSPVRRRLSREGDRGSSPADPGPDQMANNHRLRFLPARCSYRGASHRA